MEKRSLTVLEIVKARINELARILNMISSEHTYYQIIVRNYDLNMRLKSALEADLEERSVR